MHDYVYTQLDKKGALTWYGEKDILKVCNHQINDYLSKYLQNYFPDPRCKKSLDIGTGTGTCALFLSKAGFTSSGHDISQQAIKIAKKNAEALNLDTEFHIGDVCNLDIYCCLFWRSVTIWIKLFFS